MADPITERLKSLFNHTQQSARPSQSLMMARLFMMLTCLAAVGIAMAIGPLPVGQNGDLVVSSVMIAAACTSRRSNNILGEKMPTIINKWIRQFTKSMRPFPSTKPSLQNHQKTAWSRTARGASLLTAEIKPRGPFFYVTGRAL